MEAPTLTATEKVRIDAVALAIRYYADCAKQRMFLPKRDDVDLNVEITPSVGELLETAETITGFIKFGNLRITEDA